MSGSDGPPLRAWSRRHALIGGSSLGAAAMLPGHAPASVAVARQTMPRDLVVPPTLRARLPKLEASGLAWSTALDRYLVVIDDTVDDDDGDKRAPIVLTLDRTGRFDERPMPLQGVEHLDDAEALCAAGPSRFFLLTSHAPNKKGRVRPARRQLLDLRLQAGQLRVTGRVDLAEGPGGIPAVLSEARIKAPRGIDAEAVAFRDGAIWVGLKAPVDGNGHAILVNLGPPDRVFARDRLDAGAASVAARLRLTVAGPAGAPVPQGISDLVYDRDGTLYATANAPKGGPDDGGGSLWLSRPQPGAPPPQCLARFPGLRPEGLCPTPQGRALMVMFDRGDAAPSWSTWPLPP